MKLINLFFVIGTPHGGGDNLDLAVYALSPRQAVTLWAEYYGLDEAQDLPEFEVQVHHLNASGVVPGAIPWSNPVLHIL